MFKSVGVNRRRLSLAKIEQAENKGNLFTFVEVQPILCKGNKKRLIAARNHILLQHDEAAIC